MGGTVKSSLSPKAIKSKMVESFILSLNNLDVINLANDAALI